MRMWKVNPRLLCNQHLLGEHVELHMFVGCLRRGISLRGYLEGGLVEIHNLRRRHAELAMEMRRRGMRHASPLPVFHRRIAGRVDIRRTLRDLAARCRQCRHRARSRRRS